MKVVITSRSFGQISDAPNRILDEAGIEAIHMGKDFDYAEFAKVIPEADALIIGGHQFLPEDLRRCPKLRIICKHGAGVDNIPLETAKEMGITVTNAPAMNSEAVADFTFAHILNISRGVSIAAAGIRAGGYKAFTGRDVYGKTLGLIGFGAIGKAVTRRALGFAMRVLVYDPYVSALAREWGAKVSLAAFDDLIALSDIVSIHAPLTEDTKNLFDKKTISRMKKDAILVNAARGGIVNERDLYECVKGGHLFGAALDVTEDEPIRPDNPLLTLDNVVITPHMGMYSIEAMSAVSVVCAENVARKLRGEEALYVVS